MITDRQVKTAIEKVDSSRERAGEPENPGERGSRKISIELKDPGARGSGRLAMIIRSRSGGVSAEWYAIYYIAGNRRMAKIGSYPLLSVAKARGMFQADWASKIAAGEDPAVERRQAAAKGTVADLFDAYTASLAGRPAQKEVERMLRKAAAAIGKSRPASSISTRDITPHLTSIFERGSATHANTVRAYIAAAFSFGMNSEHDYTQKRVSAGWGIKINPATPIPINNAAVRVGDRFLSPAELRIVWNWFVSRQELSLFSSAVLLRIATGQRSEEILKIATEETAKLAPERLAAYDRSRGMVHWGKTKNGRPHSIPLPRQAIEILEAMVPNRHGLYFPHQFDATRPAAAHSFHKAIGPFLQRNPGFQPFTARDLRRTFKTLAGDAGVSKEMRDRLQNHAGGDVSSRHYDRYSYLPEKRAAMETWAAYLDRVIAGEVEEIGRGNVWPLRGEVAA
jgi:integrase